MRGGPPTRVLLDLTAMDRVHTIDQEGMTVTVEAGIRWSKLIHQLDREGLQLGFRGPYGGNAATVAGSVSSNSIGYGSSKHGNCGDSVVALEVVLPTGEVLRTGSGWRREAARAGSGMPSLFARYCTFNDLTGLFIGDHGMLGVKTAVTLRLYPKSQGEAFLDFKFTSIHDAAKAMLEIQRRHLAEELVLACDRETITNIAPEYLEQHPDLAAVMAVIIQEPTQEIADAKRELATKLATESGGQRLGAFYSKTHWMGMFDQVQPLFEQGFWWNTCHLRPIPTLPALIEQAHSLFQRHCLKEKNITWVASALGVGHCHCSGWITLFLGKGAREEDLKACWQELKELELKLDAVPYWSGLLWEPHILPRTAKPLLGLVATLKKALDPNNILHPSTFGLGG